MFVDAFMTRLRARDQGLENKTTYYWTKVRTLEPISSPFLRHKAENCGKSWIVFRNYRKAIDVVTEAYSSNG